MRQKGFSNVFVIVGVICISLLALYLYAHSDEQSPKTTNQEINNFSAVPIIEKKITYQSKVETASNSSRVVFIERDNSKEALYVADNDLSEGSKKLIHKFDLPGAAGFTPPVLTPGDYLVMPYAGGDANDIVIFTPEGKLITESVSQSNPDIINWQVSYKLDSIQDNKINIQLFKVDDSRAEAVIDLLTGKVVPGSFKNLPKAS